MSKYFNNTKRPVFNFIQKNLVYKMGTPEIIRITMLLNLLTACLTPFVGISDPIKEEVFEKFFVYAFSWSMGGLFEAKERVMFHKEILEFMKAPLPNIAPQ